jgi:peptide chain release factor 3
LARWVDADPDQLRDMKLSTNSRVVHDQFGNPAVLFQTQWDCDYTQRQNNTIQFVAIRTPRWQEQSAIPEILAE